ncbi:MAG: LysR family transcriptional regulator [Clostridia bacterium]|nr:LysR family transcriptional regulator [Clostridia bacterium]
MDISKISAFLLAVEKKSFSKAAEELSYTPSALSHIADSIELELGIKLLNRTFNGVELNENGKQLIDKLYAVVETEKALISSANSLKESNVNLRIGAYSSIAQRLLPDIIKKFKQENQKVKVSIKIGNQLRAWLKEDISDVIFTDAKPDNAKWHELLCDPYIALAPKNVLPNKKVVNKDELYDYACIVHNETVVFDNYFERNKFKEIIEFDSIDESSVISMVEKNLGIAVLPSLLVKHKSSGVHILKLKPEISRTIGFAYKTEALQNDYTAKFIKFIKKEFNL